MANKKQIERDKTLVYQNGLYYKKDTNLVVKMDPYGMGINKYTAPNNFGALKYIKGL
jgi:hypothetical protein